MTVSGAAGLPTARRASARRTIDPRREVIASAALAGFSVATMIGWIRVFDSRDYLTPTIATVLAIHGASLVLRLVGAKPVVTTIGTTVFGTWFALLIQFQATFRFLLPTGDTIAALRVHIDELLAAFPEAVAPVPPTASWVTLAVGAALLVATAGDVFAFGASGVGESLVPGTLVFIIVAVLGADRHRVTLTALLIASGIITVGALGWHHDRVARIRVESPGLINTAAPSVVAIAVVVAIFAAAVGPRLPGAGGEPVIDPKGGLGGRSQTAPSPLLDIRDRLTDQSDDVMFRVDAERESYWRLTTLSKFDGNTFGFSDQAIDHIEQPRQVIGDDALVQRIVIEALDGYMVPAAAEPRQAEGTAEFGETLTLRINFDSATLVSPRDHAPNDSFLVVSIPNDPPPEALRAAGVHPGTDPVFLELPDDMPDEIGQVARDVTADQGTDYDRLIALQNWFRDSFTYDTDIDLGHSSDAMAEFLTTKAGYCVQFATTFAAMARTLGIPSRVAVGYTPGAPGSDDVHTVTGRNAHAWPEIAFDGIGWVAFEPTPGRGIPGAELYTGVPAQQDSPAEDTPTVTTAPPNPSESIAPTTTLVPSASAVTAPTTPTSEVVGPGTGQGTGDDDGFNFGWLLLVVVVAAIVAAAPWLARRIVRSNEQRLAPRARSQAAWARCQRSVRRAGVNVPNGSTQQWIDETQKRLPSAAEAMEQVGRANDFAIFAPSDASEPIDADRVSELADEVESVVFDQLDGSERARAWFSVR